jgi:hypothetical protein
MKFLLTILAISLSGVVAECAPNSRPAPLGGGPTTVYVAMGMLDIDKIDSADQSFTANLVVVVSWRDPRLSDKAGNTLPLSEIWHPRIQFVNQQRIWETLPKEAKISSNGTVEYFQRVWGSFSQPIDLREFPFDSQKFESKIAAVGNTPETVEFKQNPEIPSGVASDFSLPDWKVTGWKLDISPYAPLTPKRQTASATLTITAKRYSSHYVLKIILPLVLIMAMSWIVFWIDPVEQGTQIGVATTSMLTLIAYRFMIGGKLPPVPYLTRMDMFILGATFLVFLALLQSVVTSTMAKNGRHELARKMDRICRITFPLAFGVVSYIAFATNL